MYFKSRAAAGKELAEQMVGSYDGNETAVIALSEGGVMVGLEIAAALNCSLNLLLVDPIEIPGEIDPIGAISETGTFAFNKMYAPGEIEELMQDYRGYVEQEKRTSLSKLHQLAGPGDSIRIDDLHNKHLILVSDGFGTGYSLDIALDVFKPVASLSISVAAPIISPEAIDRMRVLCDRMFYLRVAENFLDTAHYYETKDLPDRDELMRIVREFTNRKRIAITQIASDVVKSVTANPTENSAKPSDHTE